MRGTGGGGGAPARINENNDVWYDVLSPHDVLPRFVVSEYICAACGEPLLYHVNGNANVLNGFIEGMVIEQDKVVAAGRPYHTRCAPRGLGGG